MVFELTNREWGSVILAALVVAALLIWPRTRSALEAGVVDILRALAQPKILIPFGLYAAYVAAILLAASSAHIWALALLKDTLIIAVFVGVPLFFKVNKVKDELAFAWDVIRDPIRISALLVFYLNIAPLAIWAEVIVQGVLGFLVVLRVFGATQQSARTLVRVLDVIITGIAVWLVVDTALRLAAEWTTLPWADIRDSFLLSIWLPVLLIPFVYVLALYAAYEQIIVMLPFFLEEKRPRFRAVLALIVGSHLRTAYATRIVGQWRGKLARAMSFREGLAVMRAFRLDYVAQREQYKTDQVKLAQHAGVSGVDEDGLQLDRRECAATKKALTDLYFMELGWHRNQLGHYRGDLVAFLTDTNTRWLPEEHGIHEVVRADKQAWRAWRETPSGWIFAVGGTSDVSRRWQFDGPTAPTTFPSAKSGWCDVNRGDGSAEWNATEPLDQAPN